MKKVVSLLLVIVMILSLAACGSKGSDSGSPGSNSGSPGSDSEKPINVKVATLAADETPINQFVYKFEEEVDRLLPGRFEWTNYINGAMGNEREIGEAVINGDVQASIPACSVMASVIPLTTTILQDCFFLFHGVEHMYQCLDAGYRDAMDQDYEKNGGVNVGYLYYTSQEIGNTKKPVKVPDDLKGLKIRCYESAAPFAFLKGVGAIPVTMAWGELYTAMQQGTIDGVYTSRNSFGSSGKLAEVNKYHTLLEATTTGWALTFNKEWFDALPADAQEAFMQAGKVAEEWARYEGSVGLSKTDLEFFEECGVEVYQPTDAEMELWKAAAKEYSWPIIQETVGEELWAKALEWSELS